MLRHKNHHQNALEAHMQINISVFAEFYFKRLKNVPLFVIGFRVAPGQTARKAQEI